jgi:hypothetical protein
LEGDSEFSESERLHLNLPKEMLPILILAGLSGPWKELLKEYTSKETVTYEEVKKRIEINLKNMKQGLISLPDWSWKNQRIILPVDGDI